MGLRVGRFVARRLEVVAVAGLLWISWCVLSVVGFRFHFRFLYFERIQHTAVRGHLASCNSLLLRSSNQARPRERSDRGRFLPIGKKASSYRGAYRVSLFERV